MGQLSDVNAAIEEERKIKNEVLEQLGLTERKANAMSGELEESKALLEAAIRGQRQVEQELIDTREQVTDMNGSNTSLTNAKRKLENDIHQMQADLDNMLSSCKNSEEKAKKAMVDAGRLADELRAEQDHAAAQEKAARTPTRCTRPSPRVSVGSRSFSSNRKRTRRTRIASPTSSTNCNRRSSRTRSRLKRPRRLPPSTWQSSGRHSR